MGPLSALLVLACAAATPAGNSAQPPAQSYRAVMRSQYAAQGAPIPQRAEEAKRVYDAYLSSIGEKTKGNSQDSTGSAGDTAH
ncbi:MAG TPA: hypothetical protein VMF58_01910 [Rhizomicrobium sp.]|nr:hypothetical protein [Rhizomicrobium sp.]